MRSTIKVLSQHSLLVTVQEDFWGYIVGKEGIICQVGMKWGLITLMLSLNEMTILIW